MDIRPNSYQADYWTGAAGHNWVRSRPSYDAELAQFGDEVLRRAAITTGERVLDVGCGTGAMTVQAAESAAPGGVVGLDISDTMLEAAIERARDAGVTNTTFTSADAQRGPIAGSPFDVVISRFGVMFFEDSTAAFANIGAATRPDGRLAFACWQAPEDNPWMTETNAAIAAFVESPSVSADAARSFRTSTSRLVMPSARSDAGTAESPRPCRGIGAPI